MDDLLTKVSSLRPPPLALSPNILATKSDNLAFSACLWTSDTEIDHVEKWAAEWRGPVSLLVTTTVAPSSQEHTKLISRLATLQRKHPPLKKHLFVHVLHLDPANDVHPNVFLNFARLLAPTPRVVLFPGNLSALPPKTLYNALRKQQPASSSALASASHARRRRRPAVLTSAAHTSFPFVPLAPLVAARDDAAWCTERFFAGMPRAADWEECLWQVWLANFGELDVRQVQGVSWDGLDAAEDAAAAKLHRRLVSKFRSETCGLAVRRFAALRDPSSSADTKKARWLKRVCRSWTSS
ncbi:hypothetical protein BD413DRAFT_604796 [Trametes elegans]|nr:hypothetical protein BD413DRAFT_604796 [Trametes elegans]